MIVILHPDIDKNSVQYQELITFLAGLQSITYRIHDVTGSEQMLTEVYLIGDTNYLNTVDIEAFPCVDRVVRISREYRILGRHKNDFRSHRFQYNGVTFSQDNLNVFAGLCAVSTPKHVEQMMKVLNEHDQVCTRMGIYKPRTNPYSFQGFGKQSLPYVFELAGKYGIQVIAMEITHEKHIEEINDTLESTGHPTGVMLQIGTRNTQNFELLKAVGRQKEMPILIKRGFGIALEESLNAAEYLASEGNRNVVFCLRGMKTNMGDPHRNLVDFSHVPVVKRLTHMPVCIDPSHAVGSREANIDGISDISHAAVQGIIAGANMVLADFHPEPAEALVDGPQALHTRELTVFLQDLAIAREAYEKRKKLYSDTV